MDEPKTKNSRRTIHLTDAAVRALREHLARQMENMQRLGGLYGIRGSHMCFTN